MIQLQKLMKKYGKRRKSFSCLEDVNLTFEDASLNLIIGKSGSGKTTLINLIGGIDQADSGNILFDGTPITKKNVDAYRGANVGFVFQTLNLIESFTLRENFKIAFDLCSKEMSEDSLSKVLSLVSLPDPGVSVDEFLSRYPKELSVGQKQRAAIAIALVKDPSVLILDEPTSALDEENAGNLLVLLKELARKITVIVTSHDRDLFYDAADQVIEIKDRHAYVRKENGKRTEQKEKPVMRSGFFSFVETLRIALFNLRNKKMRLVTSFILSFVAAGLFGVFYLLQTVDTNSVLLRTQIQEKSYGARIDHMGFYYDRLHDSFKHYSEIVFSDSQIQKIKEYTGGRCAPIFDADFKRYMGSIAGKNGGLEYSFLGRVFSDGKIIGLNPNTGMDDFSLVRYSALEPDTPCRLPRNENEIAISDLMAEVLKSDGFIQYDTDTEYKTLYVKKVDDLIGMKLDDEMTITGIFTTPDHELDFWKNLIGKTLDDVDCVLNSSYLKNRINSDFLASYFFMSFDEKKQLNQGNSSYYVFLKNNYNKDIEFLKSFQENRRFIRLKNSYSGFLGLEKRFVNNVTQYYLWVFLFLMFAISFISSRDFFYSIVQLMKKDLFIFKAMGASKVAIGFIYVVLASMLSVTEFLLTVVLLSFVSVFINLYCQIGLITLNGAVIGWLILILVVMALLVSLLSSKKAIKQRPINVIQQ